MPAHRIVIADDHAHVRAALAALLSTAPGIEVAGIASYGAEAIALVERHRPAVLVADVEMPDMSGFDLLRLVSSRFPAIRVIAISMYAGYRERALDAGAHAFHVKTDPPEQLLDAIQQATE
jgi:two-component system, NarL family, response regulator DesR